MSDKTGIEWTDATWNPVTGCDQISPGCDNCYAKTIAGRWWAKQYPPNEDGTPRVFENVRLHPERLRIPLGWKEPRRVFVNSMSDLFHESVSDDFIAGVFDVMGWSCPQHQFQVLTKRPKRMAEVVTRIVAEKFGGTPPANVWLGTSIELDRYTWRANYLRDTPAAVRFISAEPLLGSLPSLKLCFDGCQACSFEAEWPKNFGIPGRFEHKRAIDWLIVGGESNGPEERQLIRRHCPRGCRSAPGFNDSGTCDGTGWVPKDDCLEWVRDLRDRSQHAGTALFFKQWGGSTPKAGGRLLDGREWSEFPSSLVPA